MESIFQQRIKTGLNFFTPISLIKNYKNLEVLDKLFGAVNVSSIPFDRSFLFSGDVVLDFCNRIGVSSSGLNVVRVNESLSIQIVKALYTYNKTVLPKGFSKRKHRHRLDKHVIAKLKEVEGEKLSFSAGIVDPVIEESRTSINWIEERMGYSFFEGGGAEPNVFCEEDLLVPDAEILTWAIKGIISEYPSAYKDLIALNFGCLQKVYKYGYKKIP